MSHRDRYSELDALRVIGAFSIILFHYTFRGYAADHMSGLTFSALGDFTKYGYLASYLFFVLSGFATTSSAQSKSLSSFIRSRFFRIFPSFWIAVTLTALATLLWGGDRYHIEPRQYLVNLTMLSGYLGVEPVDTVYWFMFVMLRFYFLVAVLILAGAVKYYKHAAGIWLAVALVVNACRIPRLGFFTIPEYAPFFISGMIFLSAKKEGWDFYKSTVIIVAFMLAIYNIEGEIAGFNKHYHTELSLLTVRVLLLSIYVCLFWVSVHEQPIHLPGAIRRLGSATYPLYLIHQHIGFMLFNTFGHVANKYVVLTGTMLLMSLLSLSISEFLDPYLVSAIRKTATSAREHGCSWATAAHRSRSRRTHLLRMDT